MSIFERARADDARLAELAGDHGRMAGGAAFTGQDALGRDHAVHVIRLGERADHDDRPFLSHLLGQIGVEIRLTDGRAGGGVDAGRQQLAFLRRGLLGRRVELRVQQRVDVVGGHAHHRFPLTDQPLGRHVHRDLDGRGRGALAVAGLEHPQLAALDGELDVLHVAVVLLQDRADVHELLVRFGQLFAHHRHLLRRADAGDHVLALGVDQVLAVDGLLAGARVAGECHAGAGGVAHVAEDHGHDVDRGAQVVGDALVVAVIERALAVPALEDGLGRQAELVDGVLREVEALVLLDDRLVLAGQCLEVLGGQIDVQLGADLLLHAVERMLERGVGDIQHDLAEALDEAAVGVPRKAGILRQAGQALDGRIGQADVEDGVHHARHGLLGAGAAGDEERVLRVAEALARGLLDLLQRDQLLFPHPLGELFARCQVGVARLGSDGETGRDRQLDARHLEQVCALAAEQRTHRVPTAVDVLFRVLDLGEQIDPLLSHWCKNLLMNAPASALAL